MAWFVLVLPLRLIDFDGYAFFLGISARRIALHRISFFAATVYVLSLDDMWSVTDLFVSMPHTHTHASCHCDQTVFHSQELPAGASRLEAGECPSSQSWCVVVHSKSSVGV